MTSGPNSVSSILEIYIVLFLCVYEVSTVYMNVEMLYRDAYIMSCVLCFSLFLFGLS
jgi:hypothetical protein